MAYTTYNVGAHRVIHRFTDINADFPANGVIVTDESGVFIDAAGGSVDIQVTYDPIDEINAGTANFYTMITVAGSAVEEHKLTDYGPTAVKLVAGAAGSRGYITA